MALKKNKKTELTYDHNESRMIDKEMRNYVPRIMAGKNSVGWGLIGMLCIF